MLNFGPVARGELTLLELVEREGLTKSDLQDLTNEMIDRMLALLADCADADVTFVPSDPEANDAYAVDADEVNLAWTLGHVVAHTTASAEESAFLAAELARGVEFHGRSRYETPWRAVTTIDQCRARLHESRRMRLALLDVFPDHPHFENRYSPRPGAEHNCLSRFVSGLQHDDSHLGQIEEIVNQAHAARVPA